MTAFAPRPVPPAWLGLAAHALDAARREDHLRTKRTVERIARDYGTDTLIDVMLAWIDTYTEACGQGKPRDRAIRLAFQLDGHAQITTADEVPPATAWAGRLMAARMADDEATFRALIESTPDDEAWSAQVSALLSTVALGINRAAGEPA